MATQDNEEKGERGGLMGALKRTPGYAYSTAMRAANAYGVASTIAGTFLGAAVQPEVRKFMVAREGYDRYKRSEQIKDRTSEWKAPEDDPDSKYDPKTDTTLHKVRPAFGSTAVTDAMFSPIDTLKRLLTRESGREGAEESSELPQVVNAADLGISEPGANMYADLESEAVTEEPGANMYEDLEGSDDSGPVNYSLTDGSSTDTMGQDIGVGEKRDVFGFPTDYEGDYDNAEKEWDAIHSQYVDMHNGRGNIKLDSPEGQALNSRFNYIADKIDEANKRRTDEHMRTFGSETSEERTYETDTRQYDQYGFPSEYDGGAGVDSLFGVNWDNATQELENARDPETGEIDRRTLSPERQKYLEDLIKDAEKRKADSDSATPGGGQTSTGGSTRTTAHRPGYAVGGRQIVGALELSVIPHARSQELQNGRIVLQGRSYDVVGNTGDKFLVPSPEQAALDKALGYKGTVS
jgi:hypothetical protein